MLPSLQPPTLSLSLSLAYVAATASSAVANSCGNVLPRRVARRKIPCAAFALKKYRGSAWVCSTCDKEHSTATLGDSEVARVKSSPFNVREACVGQCKDEDSEIAPLITAKESWHVLVDDPVSLDMRCKGDHVEDEDGALARKALPLACDTEVLTGGSTANNVNSSHESDVTGPLLRRGDVVMLGNVGPVPVKDGPRVLVNLDLPNAGHPGAVQPKVKAADAREGGQVGQRHDTPPRIFADWLDTVSTDTYPVSTGTTNNGRTP